MTLEDMRREEGVEKGMEIGMRTSLIEMANQGLVLKFKKVPREVSTGIQELGIPALKIIMWKLMNDNFKSLDDVREYL